MEKTLYLWDFAALWDATIEAETLLHHGYTVVRIMSRNEKRCVKVVRRRK